MFGARLRGACALNSEAVADGVAESVASATASAPDATYCGQLHVVGRVGRHDRPDGRDGSGGARPSPQELGRSVIRRVWSTGAPQEPPVQRALE